MSKRGGKRPGAGRPPRADGRRWRVVKMALTDAEYEAVKAIPPDERREVLLGLVSYYEDMLGTKENTNRSPLWERKLIKACRPRPPLKSKGDN